MQKKIRPSFTINLLTTFFERLLQDLPETMAFTAALLSIASTAKEATDAELRTELRELFSDVLENLIIK